MTDAINQPVRRPRREQHSADMHLGQMPDLDVDSALDDRQRIVTADQSALEQDYAAQLQFAEQPITIIIAAAAERNAPNVVECFNNGKGAEVLIRGKWVSMRWLPVSVQITTKVKYAEVLMRSRQTSYRSVPAKPNQEFLQNYFPATTSQVNPISIYGNTDPRVTEWQERVLAEVE